MAEKWDELKTILSDELQSTLGKLWNSAEDEQFLRYHAEKTAKYITISKTASSAAVKEEAAYNLAMVQATLAMYAHQKAITAGQSAEELAKKVIAFIVGVLIKI